MLSHFFFSLIGYFNKITTWQSLGKIIPQPSLSPLKTTRKVEALVQNPILAQNLKDFLEIFGFDYSQKPLTPAKEEYKANSSIMKVYVFQ